VAVGNAGFQQVIISFYPALVFLDLVDTKKIILTLVNTITMCRGKALLKT
jgi:hypothetical protein